MKIMSSIMDTHHDQRVHSGYQLVILSNLHNPLKFNFFNGKTEIIIPLTVLKWIKLHNACQVFTTLSVINYKLYSYYSKIVPCFSKYPCLMTPTEQVSTSAVICLNSTVPNHIMHCLSNVTRQKRKHVACTLQSINVHFSKVLSFKK